MQRSGYLFARPSFGRGIGRLADLGGTMNDSAYRYKESPEEADALAMLADWQAVGDDFRAAFEKVEEVIEQAESESE